MANSLPKCSKCGSSPCTYRELATTAIRSENSHDYLVRALANTRTVLIKEFSQSNNRNYECQLKHCND